MFLSGEPEGQIYVEHYAFGSKGLVEIVTQTDSPAEQAAIYWEQFSEMSQAKYVPLVKKERLAQEYFFLKKKTYFMTKFTKMFTERVLFYPGYATSKQVQMTYYSSMLK